MSADRPKEFGGFSADALANMRSLEKLNMPFAQAITPGSKSFKRNGFHETYVEAGETETADRWLLTGYDGLYAIDGVAVYQGSSTTQRFRRTRLRFAVRDDQPEYPALFGGFSIIGPHGLLLLGIQFGQNVAIEVSQSFGEPKFETYFYAPSGDIYNPPFIERVVRGQVGGLAVEMHNPATFAQFQPGTGTGRVVPGAGRRLDNVQAAAAGYRWETSSLPALPGPWNYATSRLQVLRPDVFMFITSAVIGGFLVSAPSAEFPPAGSPIPLPVFLLSTNGGVSYDEINLAYLLAGGENAWKVPSGPLDNYLGFCVQPGATFDMKFLSNGFFISLMTPINTGPTTAELEPRVFIGQDLLALTQVNSPANFGVVWNSLSEMIIDPASSRIAFCLTNISGSQPDQFSKSGDEGATWTVEPLPWKSERCGFPLQTKPGVLEIMVSEGPEGLADTTQDISLWRSVDFGTTWKRIATVLSGIRRTTDTQYTSSFLDRRVYRTLGGFPTADVESYRYDSRVKPPTFIPIDGSNL